MATYSTALRSARMQAIVDEIGNNATLEIGSAGWASVLAVIPLANPAGVVSGDTLTFSFPASDVSADNTGDAAVARIKQSGGTVVIDAITVAPSGAEINLTEGVAITAGQTVTLNSGTIVHAA